MIRTKTWKGVSHSLTHSFVVSAEFAYTNGSYGLPTMTCFMPGLRPGTPFNISLHCWQNPDISQFTKNNFSEHLNLTRFEARVLVDGHLVAYVSQLTLSITHSQSNESS